MKFLSGRFTSVIVLLLFLTPLVGTELHALSHWDDTHCIETGLHFHKTEHHCILCDFVLPVGTNHCSDHDGLAIKMGTATLLSSIIPDEITAAPEYYFSLRAPPALV